MQKYYIKTACGKYVHVANNLWSLTNNKDKATKVYTKRTLDIFVQNTKEVFNKFDFIIVDNLGELYGTF